MTLKLTKADTEAVLIRTPEGMDQRFVRLRLYGQMPGLPELPHSEYLCPTKEVRRLIEQLHQALDRAEKLHGAPDQSQ